MTVKFYYAQKVYQKNQLGARLNKTEMILGVNIISGKASVESVNRASGSAKICML